MSYEPVCIPSPCVLFEDSLPGCEFEWCAIRNKPITVNSLYSLFFVVSNAIPVILHDVPDIIQTSISDLLFRLAIIQTIPYVTTFVILFIVLIITHVIAIEVGILLILLVFLLAIICVFWMVEDSSNTIYTLDDQTRALISNNLKSNQTAIIRNIGETLITPDQIACTPCSSNDILLEDEILLEEYVKIGTHDYEL